ncbi:MAG TPA: glucose 1-dehydrogenase [Chloroflexota bacterium]|nr:glucose 1-dehydrogenase [Chloroflexota bacterium]
MGTSIPTPNYRLDGQVALITGSGSGIGQGAAWALARSGADVVITELPQLRERAQETARAIAEETGRRAIAVDLNVTDLASIDAAVARTVETFGRLDVLVNSAGINRTKPVFEVTEEDWDLVLDVNLKGLFFCCQSAAREMTRRDGGAIVNIASINGVVGYFKRAPYCASKGGVVNLTRELAIELAPHQIRVNAVGPTYTETPLTIPTLGDPETRADILRRSPMGRVGQVEDMVGAIVFLASPAAGLVTGHTLLVDGGWTAW